MVPDINLQWKKVEKKKSVLLLYENTRYIIQAARQASEALLLIFSYIRREWIFHAVVAVGRRIDFHAWRPAAVGFQLFSPA